MRFPRRRGIRRFKRSALVLVLPGMEEVRIAGVFPIAIQGRSRLFRQHHGDVVANGIDAPARFGTSGRCDPAWA